MDRPYRCAVPSRLRCALQAASEAGDGDLFKAATGSPRTALRRRLATIERRLAPAAFDEMTQHQLELGRLAEIAAGLCRHDVVADDILDRALAVDSMNEVIAELRRDYLRQALVFGDGADFLATEVAQAETILQGQHCPDPFLLFHDAGSGGLRLDLGQSP